MVLRCSNFFQNHFLHCRTRWPFTGVSRGPPGPKPRKSLKNVWKNVYGPGTPKSLEKSLEKSRESGKSLEKVPKRLFQDVFQTPRGPTIKKFKLARKLQSRRLEFPTKNRATVGGSRDNCILARNFQSRSNLVFFFLIFGPSGLSGGPLGRLFSDFFGVSGPEGLRDPCKSVKAVIGL